MTIIQSGSLNTTALTVPDLYVQIVPPANYYLNGVPSNIVGLVGTATWGPVNSPVVIGNFNQYVQNFGAVQTNKYDMGTAIAAAVLQGASNFQCVRVTDGTDVAATSTIIDSGAVVPGANLTAYYTGTVGNSIVATVAQGSSYTNSTPTYKVTFAIPGGVPEVFDNIGGTGATFWTNLVNAVNLGVSGIRGPSQLVIASPSTSIGSVTMTNTGSGYTTAPTVSFSGGGGANAAGTAVLGYAISNTITVTAGGTGYTSATVTITGGGGTGATATATLNAGAVQSITVTNAGSGYTTIPTVTITGNGTGATATAALAATASIKSVTITNGGTGYTSAPTVGFSGGGGTGAAGTAVIGSALSPTIGANTFSGGTNGISSVSATTLVGSDSVPRSGMYALRGTGSSVVALVDCDSSSTYSNQVSYGLSEGSYMIMVGPSSQSISSAISAKQTAGIDTYAAKLLVGDWCYFNDITNNQIRLISPQGYICGVLGNLSPQNSSLNKPILGIVGTQKTYANQTYSAADLQSIAGAGLDIITNPVPGGNYFAARFGRNCSSNATINTDPYTRMTNYIAATLNAGMGLYVGKLQSASERNQAQNTLSTFLQNLWQQGMIGDVNNPTLPPYSVQLDANNNPSSRVALGYQQADVKIVYLSVVQYFLINVQGGQSVTIQRSTTLPAS